MDEDVFEVAVIGLGGIASSAYLPVLGTRADLRLRLMTRDRARLDALGAAYRVPAECRFTEMDALLGDDLPQAAFVHVATVAHVEIVARLLDAGVPTYVDKPLADSLTESRALVEHAERTRTPLMVGFNRRHAPAYVAAARAPRETVILQKNEADAPGVLRDIVFDDFIHVADTLRFLAPGEVSDVTVSGRVEDGMLEHVALTLSGPGFTCFGTMNRRAGAKGERLQLIGDGHWRDIRDLADGPTGWAPVGRVKGIEQICEHFLAAVRGETQFPDLQDALATHELCEQVVERLDG
ncbi:oxidoreductase domain protein [Catenulispora acidiphila DSM 44928]|uniref:Oxidoreductase domain protein n=1 Tax=Catenulispora acidiphila (strain DSM 44928 / JCM 14897 / NBRC 102108 / NRRL B-24433 / ID139908) TaxID=479433 RepID=C7Q5Z1_CATAD|nr:Gfo/Idh/MocA family oxidoreductase [Catenulispora acidiphila]ACU70088.1 oxidoreductase domain protein [Catenulispora acidiphila DSM 44928]